MSNGTPREAAFLVCLSEAYELAGRKMSDSTLVSAAKEMAARIPCPDNDIKELFVTAREYSDIPTIRTLWKAWDAIKENRCCDPSSTLSYDRQTANLRRINVMETLRLLAWKCGRYHKMMEAYLTIKVTKDKWEYKNPGLKHQFDSEMYPLMEKICGNRLGDNPFSPDHPIQKYKGVA